MYKKENALCIENVSKTYGKRRVLDKVSFSVPKGSVFGILGPNGSGKTTLLGIILDIIRANEGTYSWEGKDGMAAKINIGALLETPNFYPYLNAVQNLEIKALIKGAQVSGLPAIVEQVGLTAQKSQLFSTYSLGMKQRLAIAGCLVGDPDILVFDEPTNGLDAKGIAQMRELILALKARGKTILITSHQLDEIEKVCSHIAILNAGKLIFNGAIGEVFNEPDLLEIASADLPSLAAALRILPYLLNLEQQGELLVLSFASGHLNVGDVFTYCVEKGFVLLHLKEIKKNLTGSFLKLINQQ